MSEAKDFVDSWQFRTALVGSFVAVIGAVLCFFGLENYDGVLCSLGKAHLIAGDVAGIFGIGACVVMFGWKWLHRRRARIR